MRVFGCKEFGVCARGVISTTNTSPSFALIKQRAISIPRHYLFSKSFINEVREIKLNNFLKDFKNPEEEMEVDLMKKFKEMESSNPSPSSSLASNVIPKEKKISEQPMEVLLKEGDDCLESKILYRATEIYSECIETYPNEYLPYLQRSKAYLMKGEHAFALKDMDKALEIANSFPTLSLDMKQHIIDIYHNKAVYYFENLKYQDSEKNYNECIKLCQEILKNDPSNLHAKKVLSTSLNNLGFIELENNHVEKAIECLQQSEKVRMSEQALSSNEIELSKIYYNLARALSMNNQVIDAIQYIDKFLKFYPQHYSALILKADCCYRSGDYKKSIETCDQCYALLKSTYDAHESDDGKGPFLTRSEIKSLKKRMSSILLLKGNCYLSLDNIDKAEEAFKQAMASNRSDILPYIELGKIKMTFRQDYEQAIYYLTSGITRFASFDQEIQNFVSFETQITTLFCRAKCFERVKDLYSAIIDYEFILNQVCPSWSTSSTSEKVHIEKESTKNSATNSLELSHSKEFTVSLIIPTLCRAALLNLEVDSRNNMKKALSHLNQAIKIGEKFGEIYVVEPLHHRYHIYLNLYNYLSQQEQQGNSAAASTHLTNATNDLSRIIETLQPLKDQNTIDQDDVNVLNNAYYNRGVLKFKQKEYDEALKDFGHVDLERACSDSTTQEMKRLVARCEYHCGRYFKAISRLLM
ncbi:hypothetical protein C9374_004945 [Naegleria lovaniensis]|uniref:Uncharacterized protein n=1 Tax=Naegleria lovaniensis TaxID=51637 RepID=A0AA88GRS7_NAELO|nr:uncharacterized protein C9374_004945 [Naegleria lovaniensis]KAG2382978.1 hypothetical protein C9374_004945 [Naegleria lovaniensis]